MRMLGLAAVAVASACLAGTAVASTYSDTISNGSFNLYTFSYDGTADAFLPSVIFIGQGLYSHRVELEGGGWAYDTSPGSTNTVECHGSGPCAGLAIDAAGRASINGGGSGPNLFTIGIDNDRASFDFCAAGPTNKICAASLKPLEMTIELPGDFTLVSRSSVPEPATWAMMIAGFGLMGSALRRRRALA